MIQFILVFAVLLIALWQWDHIETLAMNIGEEIEDIRDNFAHGITPYARLGKLTGGAAIIALIITLLL